MLLVIMKYPISVQDAWNKKTVLMEHSNIDVTFNDLLNFIEIEAKICNNPNFSRDARSEFRDMHKSSSMKALLTPIRSASCKFCHNDHTTEQCKELERLSRGDVEEFAKKERLCFACLMPTSSDHYSRVCKNSVKCRICAKNHPTALHNPSLVVNAINHSSSHLQSITYNQSAIRS